MIPDSIVESGRRAFVSLASAAIPTAARVSIQGSDLLEFLSIWYRVAFQILFANLFKQNSLTINQLYRIIPEAGVFES